MTEYNEIEDLKTLRFRALNALDEVVLENVKLKKENEELMRENLELKEKVDEKEYYNYINDVHRRAIENGIDELKAAIEEEKKWYDAEKCLPLPDSKVIITVEHCPASDTYIKKWRYADE